MHFILKDISENRNADHFMIFMHKPLWLYSGKIKEQWSRVLQALEGLNYAVVSGHFHLPAATLKKGKRFLMQSPTGGKLRFPKNTEMGLFHHYTWISVNPDSAVAALIEPGSVHREAKARKAYNRYVQGLFLLKGKK